MKKKRTKRIQKKRSVNKKDMFPPPNHKHGYTALWLDLCLIVMCIDSKKFWEAFGVNTCVLDKKLEMNVYYIVDVERALYKLGHKAGVDHEWD